MATKKDLKKKSAKAAPAKSKAAVKTKAKPAAKAAASKSAAVKKAAPAKPAPKAAAKAAVKVDSKAAKKSEKLDPKLMKAAAAQHPTLVKKPDVIMKNGKPVPVKGLKPGEAEPPGDADSPLLDMSDASVRKMITKAKARGYVTYDELNKVLPSEKGMNPVKSALSLAMLQCRHPPYVM